MTEPQTDPLPPAIPLQPLIEHYKQDPRMTHTKWVQWACDCAERVLPVFESARPRDMRPRRALEAARAWIADPTQVNKDATDAAAYAAAHATDAAANAAAYAAAHATGAAAYAAAHATYAAANAATHAAHATYAAANAAAHATAYTAAHATGAAYAAADAASAADKDSNAEKTWQAIRLMEIYQWD